MGMKDTGTETKLTNKSSTGCFSRFNQDTNKIKYEN